MTKHLGRKSVDSRLAEALERIAELEQEIVIKNEQRASYDDRILALRKAMREVTGNREVPKHLWVVLCAAAEADNKAASEMPE